MKEILWPLFLIIKKLKLFKHLTLHLDYLDGLLNIDNPYFEGMVGRIYPPELQLNKVNASDTEAPFFWIYIYLFQTGLFYSKFMISAMTLILT